jgi:AcrR family transcriptional regulator
MVRWEPGVAGRLSEAALDLFAEHGFRAVTVAQIAEAAGVTERTFFRHFATKEDVLFADGDAILELLIDGIESAPTSASSAQVMRTVTAALADSFQGDRARHRLRAKMIAADPSLLERDLLKQQAWIQLVAERLRTRGTPIARATVLSAAATAAFRVAYEGWCADRGAATLRHRVHAALDQLGDDLRN